MFYEKNLHYKTKVYKNKGLDILLPDLIGIYIEYNQYILINIDSGIINSVYIKNGEWRGGYEEGIKTEYSYEGGNVFCYDSTGVLVWQWPEKGISGMRLIDQGFIDEEKRSNNKNRENLIEKGYSEDEIIPKDYANPLFRPEGQVLLQHAGPSYALLVDIASGKELDRWETR